MSMDIKKVANRNVMVGAIQLHALLRAARRLVVAAGVANDLSHPDDLPDVAIGRPLGRYAAAVEEILEGEWPS